MLRKAIALLLFSSAPAFAAPDCADSFRNAGQAIPYALERAGYGQVGGINLSSLRRSMGGIALISTSRERVKAANKDGWSNGRSTARWEVSGDRLTITVACDWWGRLASKDFLALHEYLGALGYNDDEYHISSGLWLLANPIAQARLSDSEKARVEKGIASLAYRQEARGGVVGVGGGGEGMSALARIYGMQRSLKSLNSARTESERRDAIEELNRALNSNATYYFE